MSASPVSEKPPVDPLQRVQTGLALFFGGAVFLVALLSLLLPRGGDPVADLRLDSWRPTSEEIAQERERERRLLAAFSPGEVEQALIDQLHQYGATLERAGGNPRDATVRKLHGALSEALGRYAHKHGVERYHAFGLFLRDRFVARLEALLGEVRQRGERASTFLERHPVSPSVVAFRELGGGFLPQALRAGLVSDDGSLASGGARMAGIFYLVRWFAWVQSVTDYSFRLSLSQLASFWAWKAEESRGLGLERRMELVGKVVSVWPEYPADYVRAVLLARAERWEQAALYWRRWLDTHPDDERARANLTFAESIAGAP